MAISVTVTDDGRIREGVPPASAALDASIVRLLPELIRRLRRVNYGQLVEDLAVLYYTITRGLFARSIDELEEVIMTPLFRIYRDILDDTAPGIEDVPEVFERFQVRAVALGYRTVEDATGGLVLSVPPIWLADP